MVSMIRADNFKERSQYYNKPVVNKDIENSVVSLFIQIVKEDIENKKIIGEAFIKAAGERVMSINNFVEKSDAIEYYLKSRQTQRIEELKTQRKFTKDILLEDETGRADQTELKFFKLLHLLVTGQPDNLKLIKPFETALRDYLNNIVQSKLEACENQRDRKEQLEKYTNLKIKLAELCKHITNE